MDIKEVVEKVVSLVKDGKLDVSALKSADLSSSDEYAFRLGVDLGDLDVSKVVEMAKSALGSVDGVSMRPGMRLKVQSMQRRTQLRMRSIRLRMRRKVQLRMRLRKARASSARSGRRWA